jgi:hypothetical protein
VQQHTEELLSRLSGVKAVSDNSWAARCPCRNDDNNPSTSITEANDGTVLLYCHRGLGCGAKEICEAVGLKLIDLLPDDKRTRPMDSYDERPVKREVKPKPVAKVKPASKLTLTNTYDYTDEAGNLLFQKLRYVNEEGRKEFRQRRPDGSGGYIYSLGDIPKVLYNLPAVLEAKKKGKTIWLVEGEKDADTLTALGDIATTMPGGAGKWLPIHTEALAGAKVDIIADNDEVGRKHAVAVLKELSEAGCNVMAWVCPTHKDITDYLLAGGDTMDLEQLVADDSDRIPLEPTPELEYEEPVEPPQVEEVVDERPLTKAEEAVAKIRELLDKPKLSANSIINRASLLISAAGSDAPVNPGRLVEWQSFVDEASDDTYDWVVPNLLEKRERVIVVAAEGVGKTMLARQVAILTSLGVQPFTFQRMQPIRTLTVDLENPERIIRRSSRSIFGAAMSYGYAKKSLAQIVIKPDGLNLLSASDRLLLEGYIEQAQPELLVMGPLYKSFIDPGNRTSEAVAIEVVKYLDTIRSVYGCALWLEHHAPLGESQTSRNLRPFGSAVWSRWPEFGISLQQDPTSMGEYVYDVKHFRGERDERHWPLKMKRGKKFPFETLSFKEPLR